MTMRSFVDKLKQSLFFTGKKKSIFSSKSCFPSHQKWPSGVKVTESDVFTVLSSVAVSCEQSLQPSNIGFLFLHGLVMTWLCLLVVVRAAIPEGKISILTSWDHNLSSRSLLSKKKKKEVGAGSLPLIDFVMKHFTSNALKVDWKCFRRLPQPRKTKIKKFNDQIAEYKILKLPKND